VFVVNPQMVGEESQRIISKEDLEYLSYLSSEDHINYFVPHATHFVVTPLITVSGQNVFGFPKVIEEKDSLG